MTSLCLGVKGLLGVPDVLKLFEYLVESLMQGTYHTDVGCYYGEGPRLRLLGIQKEEGLGDASREGGSV